MRPEGQFAQLTYRERNSSLGKLELSVDTRSRAGEVGVGLADSPRARILVFARDVCM
jgi:hypothetical protein